eukprot:9092104-Alexandrium_andersonii.AAC.1
MRPARGADPVPAVSCPRGEPSRIFPGSIGMKPGGLQGPEARRAISGDHGQQRLQTPMDLFQNP